MEEAEDDDDLYGNEEVGHRDFEKVERKLKNEGYSDGRAAEDDLILQEEFDLGYRL